MIDDWYTQVETETAQLFQRTEENCKQYFILMSTQTEHTYKAMNRAADKVYDSVEHRSFHNRSKAVRTALFTIPTAYNGRFHQCAR